MENKNQRTRIKKAVALIAAIILSIGFLGGNLAGALKSINTIIRLILGQSNAYDTSFAFGYLLASSLYLFVIYKLFSYSRRKSIENGNGNEQAADKV